MDHNVFDMTFSGQSGMQMYRDWVLDEGGSRPAQLQNWDPEDLAAFVGGKYTGTA